MHLRFYVVDVFEQVTIPRLERVYHGRRAGNEHGLSSVVTPGTNSKY